MAGNLNSGRKSLYQDNYKEKVVKLCWQYIKARLNDKNCPVDIKTDIAKTICGRTAPTEAKGGSKSDRLIIIGSPRLTQVKENNKVIEISPS